ncbi:MAG: hypothetical protein ACLFPE_11780 [Bacteroidales bacterium]
MNRLKSAGLFLIFAVVLSLSAGAQKLDKYYSRHTQEGGDLFFFYPNEDFECSENHSELAFDISYRHGNDSAILNYTYHWKAANPADSINIEINGYRIKAAAKKLFMDFEKKMWVHRYSSKIGFDDLERFIIAESPPEIRISTEQDELVFAAPGRKWDKYAEAGEKIIYIIRNE